MKTLIEYDVNDMKGYDFKMYEKRYREWEADKCYYINDNNQRVDITPENLNLLVMEADYLINFSYSLVIVTGVLALFIMMELAIILKFQNENVSKAFFDCFLFMRRSMSWVVFILWSIGCSLIFNFDGKLITALVDNKCANDKILIATFKSMVNYLNSTHN